MFSQEFTQHSFPIHYYDMSPLLQYLKYRIEDTLPASLLLAKVILFELQCPVSFEAWRSATIPVLGFWYNQMPFQVYAQINCLSNTIYQDSDSIIQSELMRMMNDNSKDEEIQVGNYPSYIPTESVHGP